MVCSGYCTTGYTPVQVACGSILACTLHVFTYTCKLRREEKLKHLRHMHMHMHTHYGHDHNSAWYNYEVICTSSVLYIRLECPPNPIGTRFEGFRLIWDIQRHL